MEERYEGLCLEVINITYIYIYIYKYAKTNHILSNQEMGKGEMDSEMLEHRRAWDDEALINSE